MVSGNLGGGDFSVCQPNATMYRLDGLVKKCINPCRRARQHTTSNVERRAGDSFQTFILQRVQLITGAKNIRVKIDA